MTTETHSWTTESDTDTADAVPDADPNTAIGDDVDTDDGLGEVISADAESDGDIENETEDAAAATSQMLRRRIGSPRRVALVAVLVIAVVLGALVGWLGYRMQQSHHAAQQRAAFVQAARQGAVNLTTIDWQHADSDVRRVLDSATGAFYDDFAKRSKPFIDVVKQVKSKSEGNVTLAGLESITGDQAQVLVAMNVKTTTVAEPEPSPRSWRMRIDVQKVGDDVKVSNVEFVP